MTIQCNSCPKSLYQLAVLLLMNTGTSPRGVMFLWVPRGLKYGGVFGYGLMHDDQGWSMHQKLYLYRCDQPRDPGVNSSML